MRVIHRVKQSPNLGMMENLVESFKFPFKSVDVPWLFLLQYISRFLETMKSADTNIIELFYLLFRRTLWLLGKTWDHWINRFFLLNLTSSLHIPLMERRHLPW